MFTALVSGATFTGPAAVTAYGGPVPLTPDVGHFADGTLVGGQPLLMDPSQNNGVRLVPTKVDVATLGDLGFEVSN